MRKAPKALVTRKSTIFFETIKFQDVPPSAFAQVVSGAELEHRRLPSGGSSVDLLQYHLPNSVICQAIYEPAMLIDGVFAHHAVTVGTMLFQTKASIVNGSKVKTGTLQFCSEGSEICYRAWPGASWFVLVISREKLIRFCTEYLARVPNLPSEGIVTIDPISEDAGLSFSRSLRSLSHSLRSLDPCNAAGLGALMENDILTRLVQFIGEKPLMNQTSHSRRLRMYSEVFHNATRLMKGDPTEVLDLQVMSKMTGLSIRTVQRAFQAEFGMSSLAWMRIERLHRVRDDLLDERQSTSVKEAATRWGFVHLGRFSKYYRDLFGESPSITISRRAVIQNNMKQMNSKFWRPS